MEAIPKSTGPVFNYPLSTSIAERIHALPKACWANALTALRTQKELQNALYVEGWAVPLDQPIAIEHGWVELEDGVIVDPTLAVIQGEDNPDRYYRYFAGVRYTREQLLGVRTSSLPQVWKYGGWGGYQYPPYKEAYEQALSFAEVVNSNR